MKFLNDNTYFPGNKSGNELPNIELCWRGDYDKTDLARIIPIVQSQDMEEIGGSKPIML